MDIVKTRRIDGLAELHLASFEQGSGRLAEFVDTLEPGVPKDRKWVLMISTQVGCPVGCPLCDAGALGYWGNLSCDDILAQVRHIVAANPALDPATHPKLKIHFARMGEPTLNPAVLEALQRLPEAARGPGVIPSLSTVAPRTAVAERFLERLGAIKDEFYPDGRFQLQFSLHATDDEARARLVPIRTWDLERIAAYGRAFRRLGDRKVTLNFALPPDSRLDHAAIVSLFDPAHFLLKITPVNPTRTADAAGHTRVWQAPPPDISDFAGRLRAAGFDVVLSPSLAEELEAATSCGQLWSETLREQAALRARNLAREERCYVRPENLPVKAAGWRSALAPYARRTPASLRGPALLIVDMQNFFLSPRSEAFLPPARAIAANVARLAAGFRAAGRPVAFTVHAYDDASEEGPMARWWRKACRSGGEDAKVAAVFSRLDAEPVFRKTRYSAFSNPGVLGWLKESAAEALVVCGVMTNLCVESTSRDAFALGFDVRLPIDGTAAPDEALHVGALRNAAYGFAAIQSTEELLNEPCLKFS